MNNKCRMCFWREGDRCYNEKIAYIDTTPYQIDGITYTRNGELIETAIIKCCKYSVLKTREKKLKRIINN